MDVEQAKTIKASTDWQAVCDELDQWVLMELSRTRVCRPEELTAVQAHIRAFEKVKQLPQIVIEREEAPTA